jgi:hypothetical protein
VAYRLYLPKDWTKDRARRKKAGVPSKIGFKTKPEIALEQIRWACEAGLPRGVGLMEIVRDQKAKLAIQVGEASALKGQLANINMKEIKADVEQTFFGYCAAIKRDCIN